MPARTGACLTGLPCTGRKEQQQREWEERQAERRKRTDELAGEPFDHEVGARAGSAPAQLQPAAPGCLCWTPAWSSPELELLG